MPGSAFLEAPYGVHAAADGYVAISLTTMEALAAGLGAPEILEKFPDKQAATDRRDELNALVGALVATRPAQEVLDALDAAGVWCAPVNDHRAMTTDPYVRWDRRRLEVEHPVAGTIELAGNPITLDGEQLPARRPAPLLGEHTAELLAELGLDAGALVAGGVVEVPR